VNNQSFRERFKHFLLMHFCLILSLPPFLGLSKQLTHLLQSFVLHPKHLRHEVWRVRFTLFDFRKLILFLFPLTDIDMLSTDVFPVLFVTGLDLAAIPLLSGMTFWLVFSVLTFLTGVTQFDPLLESSSFILTLFGGEQLFAFESTDNGLEDFPLRVRLKSLPTIGLLFLLFLISLKTFLSLGRDRLKILLAFNSFFGSIINFDLHLCIRHALHLPFGSHSLTFKLQFPTEKIQI